MGLSQKALKVSFFMSSFRPPSSWCLALLSIVTRASRRRGSILKVLCVVVTMFCCPCLFNRGLFALLSLLTLTGHVHTLTICLLCCACRDACKVQLDLLKWLGMTQNYVTLLGVFISTSPCHIADPALDNFC